MIKDSSETYRLLSSKQKIKKTLLKIACSLLLLVFAGTFAGIEIFNNYNYDYFINSSGISVISEQGLPTDDFGFFDYN